MFKTIPGNKNYIISLSQEIRKSNGEGCALNIIDNKVLIPLYGKERLIDLKWLSLVAYFEVDLPEPYVLNIFNIHFENINPTYIRSVTGKTMIFKKHLVIKHENKIFRIIPNFTKYAISKCGEIIDINTKKYLKITDETKVHGVIDVYPKAYMYNPEKCYYKHTLVHRLVALAWVHNPDQLTKVLVNHIDGNKKNYHYRNLEWCTHKENMVHAINTGLREDNIPCKIRNFYTKEVIEFNSIRQANDYMGLKENTITSGNQYIVKPRLISKKYEFKLKSDTSPWFYENRTEKVSPGRYLITVTYPDNNIEYFHDLRDFKNKFEIWNIPNVNEIIDKFKQKYSLYKIELQDYYNASTIQIYNTKTNEITEAKSIAEIVRSLNIPEFAIKNCLRSSENRVKFGYAFRYKSDESWDTNFENHEKAQTRILATNQITKEKININSLRKAAKFLKCDRSTVKNAVINGFIINDWALEEIKE
jgi:hypothetical protein